MNRLISRCVLALSASAILSTNVLAADAASCQNVRMGVVNWTDVIATSAMAQVLLDGLGYKTKQTSASQQIIFAGIRDQRLDLFLGYWNPLMTRPSRRSSTPSKSRSSKNPAWKTPAPPWRCRLIWPTRA